MKLEKMTNGQMVNEIEHLLDINGWEQADNEYHDLYGIQSRKDIEKMNRYEMYLYLKKIGL